MDMAKGNGNRRGASKGISGRSGEASYAKPLGGGVKASEEPGIPTGREMLYQGTEESESLRDFFGWLEAIRVDSWEGYENSGMGGSPLGQLLYSAISLVVVHNVYAMALELTGSIDIAKRVRMASDALNRALGELQDRWPEGRTVLIKEEAFKVVDAAASRYAKLSQFAARDISAVLGNADEQE